MIAQAQVGALDVELSVEESVNSVNHSTRILPQIYAPVFIYRQVTKFDSYPYRFNTWLVR